MTTRANLYHYDVKNCYYFKGTKDENGNISFDGASGVSLPGLRSLDVSAEGDTTKIRADGRDYIVVVSNDGYTGTATFVKISDQFKRDCLNEVIDQATGMQYENADAEPNPFALVGEFKGDSENIRFVFFNCTASRPNVKGENKDNMKEPDEEELNFTASPLPLTVSDGNEGTVDINVVRGAIKKSDNATTWGAWFTTLQLPGTAPTADGEDGDDGEGGDDTTTTDTTTTTNP